MKEVGTMSHSESRLKSISFQTKVTFGGATEVGSFEA